MHYAISYARGESEDIQQKQRIWRTYDAIDGLSWGTCRPLQDRRGYLWLGSMAGLYRYDGKDFISYTVENGLIDNNVLVICKDLHERLWIGTPVGISCFDGLSFTNYTTNEGPISNRITVIYEDHRGRLWFGTQSGVSCFDGEHFTDCPPIGRLADYWIEDIYEDHADQMWFCTMNSGILCFDGKDFRSYNDRDGLIHSNTWTICEDSKERLWIGTQKGVSCFDGVSFTSFTTDDGLADNDVRRICEDHQGRLWFATQGGISCFDGQSFTNYNTRHGLLDNRVDDIIQDREGLFWVSHPFSGLVCFDPKTLQHLTTEPVTEALIQDEQGRLWFSNENKLCCLCDGQLRVKVFDVNIFSLLKDSSDGLWVGTLGDGLYRYESEDAIWNGRGDSFRMEHGLGSNNILSLIESRDGTIWVGTARPGCLCRFDGKAFNAIPSPHLAILKILEDRKGHIWIGEGTNGKGLSCYDGEKFSTYTKEDGLLSNAVQSIVEDDEGNLWIGTQEGLCRFDGVSFTSYGKRCGFFSSNHKLSVKDIFGHLWFGTLRGGLYRTDGKHFQMLGTEDGLPSNGITGLLPQKDGSVIIGTYRGIIRYYPSAKAPPMIEIREVTADRVYQHPQELKFTTRDADLITISYHGISFSTRRMRYSYILEGYDKEWQDTWDSQVRYENIPPNEYTFKVVAVNRDLVCSELPSVLKLGVVPDLWSQLRSEYEAEIKRMQKLLEINHLINSQDTLSDAALAIVQGLRELGFDRAGVWIRDIGEKQLHGLWGTDLFGNVYKNEDEIHPIDGIPPSEGYHIVIDKSLLKDKLGIDTSDIFLKKNSDEGIFDSIWGYPPPCPGYYRRDEWGDSICLCLATENEKIGILAVDNHITKRRIDETSANLLSLFGTEIAMSLRRRQVEEKIKTSLREKEVLLKEIHHRVKNNLQIISSLLNLQSGYIADEKVVQIFKESQSRVRSMALVHEKLYQSRDLAGIDFASYVRDLANYLFRMCSAGSYNANNIRLKVNVDHLSLDIDTAIPCGLIINELVLNSLKHGFPSNKGYSSKDGFKGEIKIALHSYGDDRLILTVSDNGIGFPEDLDFRETDSLGLQLVNILAEQLEGNIELDRRGGTTFKIIFAAPRYRGKGVG